MVRKDPRIRRCYVHEDTPAVRNCASCGKPICRQCSLSGKIRELCRECEREESAAAGRGGAAGATLGDEPLIEVVERRHTSIGDITVTDSEVDESMFVPPSFKRRRAAREKQLAEQEAAEAESAPPPPVRKNEAPGPTPLKPKETPAPPEGRPKIPSVPARVPSATSGKKTGRAERVKTRNARRELSSKERRIKVSLKKERFKKRFATVFPEKGTSRQIMYAVPIALIAGAGTFAIWLLLAFGRTQWSQWSMVTAGIVIPWALYKGTTMKKKDGEKFFESPPSSLSMAITAVVLLLVLSVIAEFSAFAIVYRTSDLMRPLLDFGRSYFRLLDYFKIIAGFILAFVIPYFLNAGKGWSVPPWLQKIIRRKNRAS